MPGQIQNSNNKVTLNQLVSSSSPSNRRGVKVKYVSRSRQTPSTNLVRNSSSEAADRPSVTAPTTTPNQLSTIQSPVISQHQAGNRSADTGNAFQSQTRQPEPGAPAVLRRAWSLVVQQGGPGGNRAASSPPNQPSTIQSPVISQHQAENRNVSSENAQGASANPAMTEYLGREFDLLGKKFKPEKVLINPPNNAASSKLIKERLDRFERRVPGFFDPETVRRELMKAYPTVRPLEGQNADFLCFSNRPSSRTGIDKENLYDEMIQELEKNPYVGWRMTDSSASNKDYNLSVYNGVANPYSKENGFVKMSFSLESEKGTRVELHYQLNVFTGIIFDLKAARIGQSYGARPVPYHAYLDSIRDEWKEMNRQRPEQPPRLPFFKKTR